jgi:hypothetical protein
MQVDKELVSKLVQGKKASELLSETKDKLVTDLVAASQSVMNQVKACLAINDFDGAKVLLNVESQEEDKEEESVELSSAEHSKEVEEAEEESGEDEEKKTELSEEVQEEAKVELSAINSFANSIEADLKSIDSEVAAIADREVSRKLGAKLQSMFDKVLQIKGDK